LRFDHRSVKRLFYLVKNLCSSCGDEIGNVLKLTVIAEGAEAQRDFLRIDSKRQ
jgi:hypothetical protein